MKFLFIHGTGGNPNENWFPWLKNELVKKGHQVIIPQFPLNEQQNLKNWLEEFTKHRKFVDENTILIGHSLGPAFILSILEHLNIKIKASIFVSSFLGLLDNDYFDSLNKTFVTKKFDWNKIKENCNEFYMISSSSDPYINIENPKELIAKHLGVEIITLKEGGHLNSEAGFDSFDLLLNIIHVSLQKKVPWFSQSPIKSSSQLLETIKHIHFESYKLCKQSFNRYLSNSGNIGIFCHYDFEWSFLKAIQKELVHPSDNPNQKYFELIKPITIEAKEDVPKTTYTHLYIRKPDTYRHHAGDIDFYLNSEEYIQLKEDMLHRKHVLGARVFDRTDLNMIELYDPNVDVLAYVSTKEMTDKVKVKLSEHTNL